MTSPLNGGAKDRLLMEFAMNRILYSLLVLGLSFGAFAQNLPADRCQIFISRVKTDPSSHNEMQMQVMVKVGWLGNGEFIQTVGFYQSVETRDLGNDSSCHWGIHAGRSPWTVVGPSSDTSETSYGEYEFYMDIHTGSVVSECEGFGFTNIGTFFVQTNKNTYWLNPGMDSTQYFYFDDTAVNNLDYHGGEDSWVSTTRDDLKYYNPLQCQ